MTPKRNAYLLTEEDRDRIVDNLEHGLNWLKACGTGKIAESALRLRQDDGEWHSRCKAAEAAGEAVRAAQADATRARLPAAAATKAREASDGSGVRDSDATDTRVGADLPVNVVGVDANERGAREYAAPAKLAPATIAKPLPGLPPLPSRILPAPAQMPVQPGALDALLAPSKRAAEHTDDGAPDWQEFREDAAANYGTGIFGLFLWQGERLRIRGFAPCSPWWRWSIGQFYASGKRWGAWQVGRGGGKSKMMTELGALESLWQPREIPPGETWLFPYVSVIKPDARKRLAGLQSILLQGYGVQVEIGYPDGVATIDTVKNDGKASKLKDAGGNAIAFVSMASTIAALSGPNTLGIVLDELTKMRDAVTGANPSTEIVRTARQTFRSRANVHGFLCSSAMTKSGFHYETITAGQTALTFVATIGAEFIGYVLDVYERLARAEKDPEAAAMIREFAATLTADSTNVPTWLANPSQSPEATRAEEPDVMVWLREVGAFPQGGEGGTWDTLADVEIVRRAEAGHEEIADTVIGVAPSLDGSEWGIVAVSYLRNGTIAVTGDASGPVNGQTAAGRIRQQAARLGASVLCVASEHETRARSEIDASDPGSNHTPAIAKCSVYDASLLRVGPLRSLYASGRLCHAAGLQSLERIAREWLPSTGRSPRLEALAVAVKRFVDVYPWVAQGPAPEPMRGPTPGGTLLDRGENASGLLRRLGAHTGRDGVL